MFQGIKAMNEYLTNEVNMLLKNFDNYPVVLVEVISNNPAINKVKYAITENTGGFPSIRNLEATGFGSADAIGVTFECLDLMELLRTQNNVTYRTETKCNYKKCLKCGLVYSDMYAACPKCKSEKFEKIVEEVKPIHQEETKIEIPKAQLIVLLFLIALFTFIVLNCISGFLRG